MNSTLEAPAPPEQTGHPRRWAALAVLMIAGFMDLLDTTIVNVALPAIRGDLNAGYSAVQWVAAGYTLAFAVGMITGGRLGDLYGRKRMFLLGMAGFTVFSLLCGLAWSPETLVAARVLQGLSASVMIPQILSTLYATFPPSERASAGGMFGGIAGLAAILGPLLSGVLVENSVFDLGWRAIFLVNVPVGIAALIAAWIVVPDTRSDHPLKPDLRGMVLVTVALLLVLVPLVQGRELGWPTWTFVSMALSLPFFALFVWSSRARGISALVPIRLFKSRGFAGGAAMLGVFFGGMSAFFLAYTLTMQVGLGFTPLKSGLTSLPFSIGTMITIIPGDALVKRFGRYVGTVGALGFAAAMVGMLSTMDARTDFWDMVPWLLLAGLGMGAVIGPVFAMAGAKVRQEDAGAASGTLNASDQLGGALGISLLGVLFFNNLTSSAGTVFDAHTGQLQAAGVPGQAVAGMKDCYVDMVGMSDPALLPPSCQAGGGALDPAVGSVLGTVRAETFTHTFSTMSWYIVAALGVVALLSFLLPRRLPADATQLNH
ncbi:MFS transporter [Actinocrispum wychmicini]|uniref:EmrB/QacA subfamily drug resistance transporter n=1 Tax=Actinocrispum wychmicini TaxID=1213861 RepID=A0A4R2JLZ3_9PSEU|nr:MFS transporter [Actinocrispum wychmicini]TCO58126.1 EmrB/QacA subfamily drug resistance transporter [Actinocrispum wychmicini]